MSSNTDDQEKVALYEARVAVLASLLAESESRLAFFRSRVADPPRTRAVWVPAPKEKDTRPDVELVLGECEPQDTRTDAELKLDHRSGSGENSAKCREQFEEWLGNHGMPGEWHSTADMCADLNSWPRFTKHVVDAVLEQLVKDSVVEVQRNPYSNWPNRIRLKQQQVAEVFY